MNLTNYLTEQNIYHAVFILLASGLLWAILWGRKWKKTAAWLKEQAEELSGMHYQHFLEKLELNRQLQNHIAEKDQMIAFKNKQLDQKDAKIQEILDYSNDQAHHMLISHEEAQKIKSQMIREILVLKALLKATSNYARLIIHDPVKLEKWLDKLKGKKGVKKAKKTVEARFENIPIGYKPDSFKG